MSAIFPLRGWPSKRSPAGSSLAIAITSTFRNCVFEDALHGAKGGARFIECTDCRLLDCSFKRSSFDSLALEKCERMLVENCTFDSAAHSLLALRGSSHNVIRHCNFKNPYFEKQRAEKLVEVFDVKLDRRNPANPSYIAVPSTTARGGTCLRTIILVSPISAEPRRPAFRHPVLRPGRHYSPKFFCQSDCAKRLIQMLPTPSRAGSV